jgi:hypothetical protein
MKTLIDDKVRGELLEAAWLVYARQYPSMSMAQREHRYVGFVDGWKLAIETQAEAERRLAQLA